jgi:hypothetical protein
LKSSLAFLQSKSKEKHPAFPFCENFVNAFTIIQRKLTDGFAGI